VNKSWSGFLPQNEVIKLQWALMEGNWAKQGAWPWPAESLEPESESEPVELDTSFGAALYPPNSRKR
jgi:hypothetical protein